MATTPRKPAGISPDLVLNLDDLERPKKDIKAPFTVGIADRTVTFVDPAELDWDTLAGLDSPGDFIDYCLSPEDRDHVLEATREGKIPGWKFKVLWETYQQHYGIDTRGNGRA